ncbi:hypothetical protein HELRODRAFT_167055 [Helobdella robusta]|uniref:VWFA domain-containing protein n=1 Tax=Helobdella robusta TaxID=6412 RepID=T1EYY5_HELRO|nr:hypothetical protein HELRODRAFT_167055 [Helobdella robusta]ESO10553.1 hypothetical protein HELRODRAFT_167055 [Helobdella robusta]
MNGKIWVVVILKAIASPTLTLTAETSRNSCYIPNIHSSCTNLGQICLTDFKYNESRFKHLKENYEGTESKRILFFLIDDSVRYSQPASLRNLTLYDEVPNFFASLSTYLKKIGSSYSQILCYSFDKSGKSRFTWSMTAPSMFTDTTFQNCSNLMIADNSKEEVVGKKLIDGIKSFSDLALSEYQQRSDYKISLWILTDARTDERNFNTYESEVEALKISYLKNVTVFTVSMGQCPDGYFDRQVYENVMHNLASSRGQSACFHRWTDDLYNFKVDGLYQDCSSADSVQVQVPNDNKVSIGIIVGSVVGGVLFLLLIISLIFIIIFLRQKRRVNEGAELKCPTCNSSECFCPVPPVPCAKHPVKKVDQPGQHKYDNFEDGDVAQSKSLQTEGAEETVEVAYRKPNFLTKDNVNYGHQISSREKFVEVFVHAITTKYNIVCNSLPKPPVRPKNQSWLNILECGLEGWSEYLRKYSETMGIDFIACYSFDPKNNAFAKSSNTISIKIEERKELIALFSCGPAEASSVGNSKKSRKRQKQPKNLPNLEANSIPSKAYFNDINFQIIKHTKQTLVGTCFKDLFANRNRSSSHNSHNDDNDDNCYYMKPLKFHAINDCSWIAIAVFEEKDEKFEENVKSVLENILKGISGSRVWPLPAARWLSTFKHMRLSWLLAFAIESYNIEKFMAGDNKCLAATGDRMKR